MTTYTISESIRREIAEAIIKESHPGYSREFMGCHYAVDTDKDGMFDAVMFSQDNDPWSPWADNAVAIPVADLYDDSDDFSEVEEGFEEDAIAFAESQLPDEWNDGEPEPEPNPDTADLLHGQWVLYIQNPESNDVQNYYLKARCDDKPYRTETETEEFDGWVDFERDGFYVRDLESANKVIAAHSWTGEIVKVIFIN
jgi:hypothetical protein